MIEQRHINTIEAALYYARYRARAYRREWVKADNNAAILDTIDAALEALRHVNDSQTEIDSLRTLVRTTAADYDHNLTVLIEHIQRLETWRNELQDKSAAYVAALTAQQARTEANATSDEARRD